MERVNYRLRKGIKKLLAGVLIALMVLPTVCGFFDFTSKAADGTPGSFRGIENTKQGTPVKNAYILEIATGALEGKCIDFFLIRYNVKGETRKQYIFPRMDSLKLGRQEVSYYGTEESINSLVSEKMYVENSVNWDKAVGLRVNATDQYYFTLPDGMDSVESIDAFAEKGSWTCLGVRLFSVEEIYGLQMAGLYSSEWYIDFKGKLLMERVDSSTNYNPDGRTMLHMDTYCKWKTNFDDVNYGTHLTQDKYTMGFRLDFADIYKGGYETLCASYEDGSEVGIMDLRIPEALTLNVTYTDVYNTPRLIHLPYIINTAVWLNQKGLSGSVAGLAMEGSTIFFEGEIPDLKKINAVSVTTGHDLAMKEAGLKVRNFTNAEKERSGGKTFSAKERFEKRVKELNGDAASTTVFAVYNMQDSTVVPGLDGAVVSYEYMGKPICYKVSTTLSGEPLNINAVNNLNVREFDGKNLDGNTRKTDFYLMQIITDSVSIASTEADMTVKFSYMTMAGVKQETKDLNVKELTREYFGYWPANIEDFQYYYGTSKGQALTFMVQIPNVDYFTKATLSLASGGSDYQVSSIRILALNTTGQRKLKWEEVSTDNGKGKSHLRVSRDYNGTDITQNEAAGNEIFKHDEATLIQPGETVELDFTTGSVSEEDIGFDVNQYRISYEDAMKNYGFTKTRNTYEVNVHVASDTVASTDGSVVVSNDSDAGSENNFFFQLVFQSGTSGFVQANHQLEGDAFRSGEVATFYINTNQDYGEIEAVRIIPDQSSDKASDKLKIDKISVLEGNQSGTHRVWNAKNVGWIGIDYIEKNEKLRSHTLQEICRQIPIDTISNVVDIEIALRTGIGDKSRNVATGERVYADQFVGTARLSVIYTDIEGISGRRREYDMVKLMNQYMKKSAADVQGGMMSDPDYMFREGKTDRFIVQVEDVKSIEALEITAVAKNGYMWAINSVSGNIVEKPGKLKMNIDEEYEYAGGQTTHLFDQASESNPAVTQILTAGSSQIISIPVGENKVQIDTKYGKAVAAYSRVPVSKDDTLNIYVFPSLNANNNDMEEVDMTMEAHYVTAGGIYIVSEPRMKKFIPDQTSPLGSRPMYYATGKGASGMTDFHHLNIKALSLTATKARIDYAIVQQVRGGTIVRTYFINYGGNNACQGMLTEYPCDENTVLNYTESQKVCLQLGAGTEEGGLVSKGVDQKYKDVGVCIEYKSAFDPFGTTYRSPIKYFTDEDVAINRVRDGMVAELQFDELFIGEITGLCAYSTGSPVSIQSAYVSTYHNEMVSKASTLQGWYSFASGVMLSETMVTMERTGADISAVDCVIPLTMTFKTSEASESYESGTNCPVKATIYTVDAQDIPNQPIEIYDLRKYLTDGKTNFQTGKTQTVKLLVRGNSVRRVTIEPVTGNNTGGWSIDSVTAQIGDNDPVTRILNTRVFEGTPKDITLANVTVTADVYVPNAQTGANDIFHVTNNTLNIVSAPDKSIAIVPRVNGSELGYTISAAEVNGDNYISGNLPDCLKNEEVQWRFTPPANTNNRDRYYRITIVSTETAEAKAIINVSVLGNGTSTVVIDPATTAEIVEKTEQAKKASADKAAAEQVIAKIEQIPLPITLNSKAGIDNARAAYNSLTDEQKTLVNNYGTLDAAERAYAALVTSEENVNAANSVMELINKIGEVTLDSKGAITAARSAYDALTLDQQALVENYTTLASAEFRYSELEEEKKKQEEEEKKKEEEEGKEDDQKKDDQGEQSSEQGNQGDQNTEQGDQSGQDSGQGEQSQEGTEQG